MRNSRVLYLITTVSGLALTAACSSGSHGSNGPVPGPDAVQQHATQKPDSSAASSTGSVSAQAPVANNSGSSSVLPSSNSGRSWKPELIVSSGQLEQTVTYGQPVSKIALADKNGQPITLKMADYYGGRPTTYCGQSIFAISGSAVTVDTSKIDLNTYTWPQVCAIKVTGTAGFQTSDAVTLFVTVNRTNEQACSVVTGSAWNGSACERIPTTEAYLASKASLEGQTITQGDVISRIQLTIYQTTDADVPTYRLDDQTCANFFSLADEHSEDLYRYVYVDAASTVTQATGTCEAKLRSVKNGVAATDFVPLKVTVVGGMGFYGVCSAATNSISTANTVSLVMQQMRATGSTACRDTAIGLKTTRTLVLDGSTLPAGTRDSANRIAVDLSPLATLANAFALTLKDVVVTPPATGSLMLNGLSLLNAQLSDLAWVKNGSLLNLTIAHSTLPISFVGEVARQTGLVTLQLGTFPGLYEYRGAVPGSGLSSFPDTSSMAALTTLSISDRYADAAPYSIALDGLTQLQTIDVESNRLASVTFKNLPALSSVNLRSTTFAALDVENVPKLTALTADLRQVPGSQLVLDASALQTLELNAVPKDFSLAKLPNLTRLAFRGTAPSHRTMASAAAPQSLQTLQLAVDHRFAAAGTNALDLSSFANLQQLRLLDVSSPAEAADFSALKLPGSLTSLVINGGVNLKLTELGNLTHLSDVEITGTKLAAAADDSLLSVSAVINAIFPVARSLSTSKISISLDGLNLQPEHAASVPVIVADSVTSLTLNQMQTGPMTWLSKLKNLSYLALSGTQADDQSVAAIGTLTSLTSLSLVGGYSPVGGDAVTLGAVSDLSPLAKLTGITRVIVTQQPVASLAPLKDLEHLAAVNFSGDDLKKIDDETGTTCPYDAKSAALVDFCAHSLGL